jgi:hypothetical protein
MKSTKCSLLQIPGNMVPYPISRKLRSRDMARQSRVFSPTMKWNQDQSVDEVITATVAFSVALYYNYSTVDSHTVGIFFQRQLLPLKELSRTCVNCKTVLLRA